MKYSLIFSFTVDFGYKEDFRSNKITMFLFIGFISEETVLLYADSKQFFADNSELELKIYEVVRNKVFNLSDI